MEVKVIVAAVALRVVPVLLALSTGSIVSKIVDMVLDIVLGLEARSVATQEATYEVVVH